MKKIFLSVLAAFVLFSSTILPNGFSLNSIGARPFGMGGAFVGLANDYTTIYWNPAGLAQLSGNYISLFATDIIPSSTYKYNTIDAKSVTNHYIVPNLMGYISFNPSPELTIGLGAYFPAGVGSEWSAADFGAPATIEMMSQIAVANVSPVIAYKFNEQFSVGAALNIYYGMFDLKRAIPTQAGVFQYEEESDGIGFGGTIGALYKFNKMFSLGASFRTKSTVDMSGTAKNPAFGLQGFPAESEFNREVSWPMWIAGGIAVKPSEKLTFTFDAQFSQWSESENELVTEFAEPAWVAATTPNDGNKFILKWKDATQLRFGTEYMVQNNLALRAGYYYDPAPAPDETYNILFPSITFHAATIGVGYSFSNITIDAGFEYLFGEEREIPVAAHAVPGTHNTNIFAMSFGIGYGF
jgi:long-chain fatty acid transport protein